jgi:SEC-C motif-containing protein
MRSRYTANAVGDTAYLLKSRHPSTRPQSMNPRSGPDWLGLEILNTEQGRREDAWGTVEFRALYATAAGVKILHERSRFVREDGFWYYVDGDLILPTPSGEGKTGRNAPCPCGSGKKYKKCCLRRKT